MDVQDYLNRLVTLFRSELTGNLAGIYLHGSLAMGCFHPRTSDIDLLVVVQESVATETNKQIAQRLLALHHEMPVKRGMEVSIILEQHAQATVYPTPFEFHYSDDHREKYQADENYICGGYEDPDLAAHMMVTYHRGITLYGKPIREIFNPVDPTAYIKSILADIEDADKGIVDQPIYYSLNLCRVLLYLREGVISSKKEGGEWGLITLPSRYHALIQQSLDHYSSLSDETGHDLNLLRDYAHYILGEIRESTQPEV